MVLWVFLLYILNPYLVYDSCRYPSDFNKYFLRKVRGGYLPHHLCSGLPILELSVSELFQIIFTRFIFESSFSKHKEIHENRFERGPNRTKSVERSSYGYLWLLLVKVWPLTFDFIFFIGYWKIKIFPYHTPHVFPLLALYTSLMG